MQDSSEKLGVSENEALKVLQQESSSWSNSNNGGGGKHGANTAVLAKTQDLGARRQAIRELLNNRRPSNEIAQEVQSSSEVPSTATTTTTGKQVSNSTSNTPSSSVSTSVPSNPPVNLLGSIVPTHYATNSSTALLNVQKLASSQPQPSSSGVSERGANEDAMSAQIDQKRDLVTTDDIITSYAMQRNVKEAQKGVSLPNRVSLNECASTPPSSALSTSLTESSVMESAQSMFSSGNFSTLPVPLSSTTSQGDYHVPQFHASSSSISSSQQEPTNPLNQPSPFPNATNGIPSSSSSSVDSMSLSNMDLSRLIPHLEALAGSLQNPSLFESQYLASLTAQSQLFPSLASTSNCQSLPNDVSQHPSHSNTGDDKQPNIPLGGIDPSAVFPGGGLAKLSSAEIAKLLPSMVAMESQNAAVTPSEVPPNHPIYASDLDAITQLSQKMQAGVNIQESGGMSGGYSDDGQQQAGGTEVDLRTRSLPASFLLDNNFPLDIPPPNDLMPEHVCAVQYTIHRQHVHAHTHSHTHTHTHTHTHAYENTHIIMHIKTHTHS